jgi:hypothetical protein
VSARRALCALAALAAFSAVAALQASCAAVFGVDESQLHNAVTEMCQCDTLQAVDTCETTLSGRLDDANTAVQTAWLDRYVKECLDCAKAPACLSQIPTCSLDKCKISAECCTLTDAGKATCEGDHCKQP